MKDLSAAFQGMKGFSRTNLFFIKKWYLFYQACGIVSQVVRQIPGRFERGLAVDRGIGAGAWIECGVTFI